MLIRSLNTLRSENPRLGEAFDDVVTGITNLASQLGHDTGGTNIVPDKVAMVSSSHLGSGVVDIAITDNSKIVRGINYFVEIGASAGDANPRVEDLGSSRNRTIVLPNGTYFISAYSQYKTGGPPSKKVFASSAVVVSGGAGGALLGSQASGTGKPGTGGGHGAGSVNSR